MRILAIDPATVTGWRSPTSSGTFNCKLRSNESKGMKFIKFRSFIKQIIEDDDIDLVVYEKPGGRHFNGIRSHSNFEGVLLQLCEDMKIEYRDYSATEIKKFAKDTYIEVTQSAVKGQMNKARMMEFALVVYDREFIDDNHVDAYFLYELAKSQLL